MHPASHCSLAVLRTPRQSPSEPSFSCPIRRLAGRRRPLTRSERFQRPWTVRRIVRPGGIVHIAVISRWAARLDGILVQRLHERYPTLTAVVADAERTGWMPPV